MRHITKADAPWLAATHKASFPKGWSAQEFTELLASNATGLMVESTAFILWRSAADEAEIITLATAQSHRRKGHASHLIQQMLTMLATQNIRRILLEVRANNEAAIELYHILGFTHIATRPNYYSMPDGTRQNARVMEKLLSPA